MRKRLAKYENPIKTQAATVKGNDAQIQPVGLQWDEGKEMKQVNTLYSLLDDRFAKESPLPASLREPASNPTHYDDILAESERAPTRSMISTIANKLKNLVRFS